MEVGAFSGRDRLKRRHMARLHRRYGKRKKRNPSSDGPKRNPPLITDIAEFAVPGFVAFAATRFGTRVAATQIAKRKPSWGKHAGALASVGAFLAAWLLAHRWKWLAKYHTPVAVGSAIAAAQSLIQLYIPKLGWIVADATPELGSARPQQLQQGGGTTGGLPAGLSYVDENPGDYTYNDSYDAGVESTTTSAAPAAPGSANEADLIDMDFEPEEAQPMGIFGGN